ncbi:hypothetical protein ACIQCM_08720 [Pseudarthrobacter sp. NPDC092439]|uniref:hypothetical protein n=1 Tax=unclassified Pseudarthrobacter TaxID=2647000 RepID=UPI0037FE58D3
MNKSVTLLTLAAAVILTGCSDPATATSPSPTPTPPATYDTVAELKDAFVEAGGECDDWEQTNKVQIAAQSGTCGTDTVLSVYLSSEAVERRIETTKGSIFGTVGGDWLVGENWIINADGTSDLKEKLGGRIVSFAEN